jgi:hypothetical protein
VLRLIYKPTLSVPQVSGDKIAVLRFDQRESFKTPAPEGKTRPFTICTAGSARRMGSGAARAAAGGSPKTSEPRPGKTLSGKQKPIPITRSSIVIHDGKGLRQNKKKTAFIVATFVATISNAN